MVEAYEMGVVGFFRGTRGFSNRDLRSHLAPLLGVDPRVMSAGRTTYDLRRLRLHGHPFGLKTAIFFTRTHNWLLRTGLAEICDPLPIETPVRQQFDRLDVVTR